MWGLGIGSLEVQTEELHSAVLGTVRDYKKWRETKMGWARNNSKKDLSTENSPAISRSTPTAGEAVSSLRIRSLA